MAWHMCTSYGLEMSPLLVVWFEDCQVWFGYCSRYSAVWVPVGAVQLHSVCPVGCDDATELEMLRTEWRMRTSGGDPEGKVYARPERYVRSSMSRWLGRDEMLARCSAILVTTYFGRPGGHGISVS